jgi:predicted outer membrane protein
MIPLLMMFWLTPLPRADETTLWNAIHLTAQAAMEAGSLAQARAVSPEIRNLGKLVVRDEGELDRRLKVLAEAAGIVLAEEPKPGKNQLQELKELQGVDFDRNFLNFSYGASETLRKRLTEGLKSGDPSLRDLIAMFDPIIKQDEFLSGWCLGHCLPAKKP